MKLTKHVAAISSALIAGAAMLMISVSAARSANPTTAPSASPSTQPINQFCAVERDDKIDPAITTVYEGKTIGFCCKDCPPKFEKDPEKYMKGLK